MQELTTYEEMLARATDGNRPRRSNRPQNVGRSERVASLLGGAALFAAGLSRGKLGGLLMAISGGALAYRGWTGHCHGYDALGISTVGHNPATAIPAQQGAKVEHTVSIQRSPEDLYRFWRELTNLPRIMRHVQRVDLLDERRSHWVASAPVGGTVEWDAEIIQEREPELIAWRSTPDSEVATAGSVHFKALGHDRGTAVTVSLKYNPPGGKVAAAVASVFGGGLKQEIVDDLRRFKSFMEANEVPTGKSS